MAMEEKEQLRKVISFISLLFHCPASIPHPSGEMDVIVSACDASMIYIGAGTLF
jgi:hypothetical protein